MRFLYQQVSYNKPRRKNAKVGKLQSCRYLDNGVSYKGEMDNRILPFKELHQIKYLSKSDSFTIRSPSQGSCEGLFILYKIRRVHCFGVLFHGTTDALAFQGLDRGLAFHFRIRWI